MLIFKLTYFFFPPLALLSPGISVLDPLLVDGSFNLVPFLVCATSLPPLP